MSFAFVGVTYILLFPCLVNDASATDTMKLVISFTDYSRILNVYQIRIRDTHTQKHAKNKNENNVLCLFMNSFILFAAGCCANEIITKIYSFSMVKNNARKYLFLCCLHYFYLFKNSQFRDLIYSYMV